MLGKTGDCAFPSKSTQFIGIRDSWMRRTATGGMTDL
jgi:hypothetical protein